MSKTDPIVLTSETPDGRIKEIIENDITSKFTLEEIYLIRTCNLSTPDINRIISKLNDYLVLEGMKEIVRGVIGKLEYATGEELKSLWEYPLD